MGHALLLFVLMGSPQDPDSSRAIEEATLRAKKENKRVLLVFGANGSFLRKGKTGRLLRYEYEVVSVDAAANKTLAEKYGIDPDTLPQLAVLSADGKLLASGDGATRDPFPFLDKWKTEPWDAETRYQDALARAKKEGKRLLVHLGAPW